MRRASRQLTDRARTLRKHQTVSEQRLWNWFRNRTFGGYKFRRQFAVDRFVLDFYCPQLRLAFEIDGRQHDDPRVAECDDLRAQRLGQFGVTVVRIPNSVLALDSLAVEMQIRYWIEKVAADNCVER